MEVNINFGNEYYHAEKEFYEQVKKIMKKRFIKEKPYRCDVFIHNEYNQVDKYATIKIYKKSKNRKNQLITTYNKKFKKIAKIFYSKNKKNYIYILFDSEEKIKSKSFVINGKETKYIFHWKNGIVGITKYSQNDNTDDVRLNREKIFLKTCNGIQYHLYLDTKEFGEDSFIIASKKCKEIKKIRIKLAKDPLVKNKIDDLIKYGRFRNVNDLKYILYFDTCTEMSVYDIAERDRIKRIMEEKEKEKKFKEEFEKGYHTKALDINFCSDTQKQFVNKHMVKSIYDYEFKIFIDENNKYRTVTGEPIITLSSYLDKCIRRKNGEDIDKKKSSNNDYYESAGELLDEYIHEAFGGDEEAWEDYCEDIADYYDD